MSRRYLLLDDNEAFAENLAEIIRDEGNEADVVSSGEKALESVKARRYDTFLTDMRMPVMGGAQVVHAARQLDPGLPAVVMTAYTQDDELESARSEGILAVLPKPVPMKELLRLLKVARRDGLVALVEDDEALSDNLSEALRDRGFSAVTAQSVLETERLGCVRPCAAIVDLRVPGGPDGEAMRKLHARFPGIQTLVITAHSGVGGPLLGTVFNKPFQTAALLDELMRMCGCLP